ncbi:MBL fold metallo-hydrolase [Acinetobacter sp. CAAS 2-6]|uniref:MBL fold metallo-hydrolase n=1 Tax=Acinetobacter sp. CAAS 2-6 TaxID=3016358 RepID=UPI002DD61F89|nr:MBL fold metallo-hydrolase [Acinetobacter sp. CAAS 2-6]
MNKKLILTAACGFILPSLFTACVHTNTFVSQGETKIVTNNKEYLHLASTHPARISPNKDEMRITLLGTGSPVPSEQRFGMSTLVQAGGYNLVFDAGRGAVIRLTQAGMPLGKVNGVFLTHYHSDHVNGLSDLWMTGYIPAFGGRQGDFNVYGPTGVMALVEGLKMAHADDIRVRVADGELKKEATNIVAHEFSAEGGIVFNQNGVVVTAFKVEHDHHGAIQPALGYRVDYAGRSVLISGDTIPTANVLKYGKGVDLLIHEVAEFQDIQALPQVYAHHTNPREAGDIFNQTKPKMAVYSHIVNGVSSKIIGIPDEVLIQRTRVNYQGPLVVGRDLMSFLLTPNKIDVYTP